MANTDRSPPSRRFWRITLVLAALAASPMLVYSGGAASRLIFSAPQGGDNAFLVPLSLFAAAVLCFVIACALAAGVVLGAYTLRAIWRLRSE